MTNQLNMASLVAAIENEFNAVIGVKDQNVCVIRHSEFLTKADTSDRTDFYLEGGSFSFSGVVTIVEINASDIARLSNFGLLDWSINRGDFCYSGKFLSIEEAVCFLKELSILSNLSKRSYNLN